MFFANDLLDDEDQDPEKSPNFFRIGNLLQQGSYDNLEDVRKGFIIKYKYILNDLICNSILHLADAVEMLLGEQSYMWGQEYANCPLWCIDNWGWERIAKTTYDQAVNSIKSKNLLAEINVSDIFDEPIYPEQKRTIYYVKLGDILLWAIEEGISISPSLKTALRIFVPVKSKFYKKTIQLEAAFQTLFYLYPDAKATTLIDDPIIGQICGRTYSEKTLHDIARRVDPRPSSAKTSKKTLRTNPYPPVPILGTIETDSNGLLYNVKKLKIISIEIVKILRDKNPSVSFQEIISDPLVRLYLMEDGHKIMQEMAHDWISF